MNHIYYILYISYYIYIMYIRYVYIYVYIYIYIYISYRYTNLFIYIYHIYIDIHIYLYIRCCSLLSSLVTIRSDSEAFAIGATTSVDPAPASQGSQARRWCDRRSFSPCWGPLEKSPKGNSWCKRNMKYCISCTWRWMNINESDKSTADCLKKSCPLGSWGGWQWVSIGMMIKQGWSSSLSLWSSSMSIPISKEYQYIKISKYEYIKIYHQYIVIKGGARMLSSPNNIPMCSHVPSPSCQSVMRPVVHAAEIVAVWCLKTTPWC